MSAHYSKYLLNTYSTTPYFQAQVPRGYPLDRVLVKCRAFRRLPPNLRKLSALARRWAVQASPDVPGGIDGINRWYDDEGNELNPVSGQPLTDEEIDAQWSDDTDLDFQVVDIPEPPGGFADPDTWQPSEEVEPAASAPGDLTPEMILGDIESRGPEATAMAYGVPREALAGIQTDEELVAAIMGRRR